MFWILFLCHLIADYPLQTDGMVKAKQHLNGLILHTSIHLATMLIVVVGIIGLDAEIILIYLLALAVLHFAIDVFKNLSRRFDPNIVIPFYFLDQVLHIASVWLIAYWCGHESRITFFFLPWSIYLSGYILVSHVWFVTERVLSYKQPDYQNWITEQMWARMMSRMVLLTGLLLLLDLNLWGIAAIFAAFSLHVFDLNNYRQYRQRALLIDGTVTIGIVLFIKAVLFFGNAFLFLN